MAPLVNWKKNVVYKWGAVVAAFIVLCSIAIVQNTNIWITDNADCTLEKGLPTISSSLMRDGTPYRALVIGLFTISLFIFIHVRDKALLVTLHLFMLAFVVNMKKGQNEAETHTYLVLTGAAVVYVSLLHHVYEALTGNAKNNINILVICTAMAVISAVFAILFCIPVFNKELGGCDSRTWYEYAWLGLLLLSTLTIAIEQEDKSEDDDNANKTLNTDIQTIENAFGLPIRDTYHNTGKSKQSIHF